MSLITIDTPIGTVFASKPKRVSWERTWAYAGGPFALEGWPARNIHTDPAFASSVGLNEPNVTGTQTQAFVAAWLLDIFGERWLSGGKLYDVKFIRPISIEDTLQVQAEVISREYDDAAVKYTLAIKCLKGDGESALIGSAEGWVMIA